MSSQQPPVAPATDSPPTENQFMESQLATLHQQIGQHTQLLMQVRVL